VLRDAFFKGVRDLRRSFLYWAVGIAFMIILFCLFYPTVRDSAASVQKLIDSLPAAFKNVFIGQGVSFTSPKGYIDGRILSFMSPLLFLVFAVGLGARQIAGEEEAGTLSLLLSYPMSRRRLLAQKAAVLVVAIAALTVAHFGALVIGVTLEHMNPGYGALLGANVDLFLLALSLGTLSLTVGAATGRHGAAVGVSTIVAAAAYLVNALAPLSHTLKPLQKLSLFYYYGGAQPLSIGVRPVYAGLLLAVTAVLAAVAFLAFERRDVRV